MKRTLCILLGTLLSVGLSILPGAAQVAGGVPLNNAPAKEDTVPTRIPALSPLQTQVLGQNRWLRGGPAALRVIVSDHQTGKPIRAKVSIEMARVENNKPAEASQTLFSGSTGPLGTINAHFRAPAAQPGAYQLTVAVHSPLGEDTITQPIQLEESMQLLLTADKPLYQPGQTMHIRALALDTAARQALTGQTLTFEVEDARGNKVYKKKAELSRYGLASTDFILADEVNMGTFTIRAVLPQGQAEKKVRVDRYVLPKYKAVLTTEKSYYLPGEVVKGTLHANYFFGKPVFDAQVDVSVNTLDIGVTKLADLHGKTDAAGTYKFDYTLPTSFVGQPFEQGKALLELQAQVKDAADHKQEVNTSIPVVKDPISLVMVPESRSLVPGVPNRVYIAAATPDNSPLKGVHLEVRRAPMNSVTGLSTDRLGLASYDFTPGKEPVSLTVKAVDGEGHTTTVTQQFQVNPSGEGIILRTDKTLARVGDHLNLAALSPGAGTVYLDVIREKQTILTLAREISGGQALFPLPLTDDMVGTLQVHAYRILPSEDIIRDTRVIVVSPADDLDVKVLADKSEYRPGGDALLRFSVRDQQKHPVQAALGLAIVDESVFALSELQPGLEKIYFTLEKELMQPRYEIHGLTPANLVLDQHLVPGANQNPRTRIQNREEDSDRQQAAAMLFAAVDPVAGFDFRVNTYKDRWEKIKVQAVQAIIKAHKKILDALQKYQADNHAPVTEAESLTLLVDKGYLKESDLKDPWGNFYKTNLYGQHNYSGFFALSSAGPDGRWDTEDDLKDISAFNNGFGNMRFRGFAFAGARGGPMAMEQMAPPGMAGGFGGGRLEEEGAVRALGVAMAPSPMAPANALMVIKAGSVSETSPANSPEPARVRSYFPETMYWNPGLITDEKGEAELRVPMADSITTWRLSMMANSPQGQLGSGTAPLKVFQDFFVDLDLPLSLTQNDQVKIPVAVYNYLPQSQDVTLTLDQGNWFALEGPARQVVRMEAGQVKVIYYPITVHSFGHFPLTVTARGTHLSDAIRRFVEVLPDGKEIRTAVNDTLDGKASKTITLPADSIKGASSIWVKLYPGTFSQVVEGLDGILRMPNGCFEQTSSTTYPNVLVLAYLKATRRINPELQLKAEQYINVGYQRLVTFECKSGGFSWFGNEPAHQVLTAYGLLEFGDMAKVYEVDPALLRRTQAWLAGQQKENGSWEETGQGIAEGIINRQTGALRTTAYIAWALADSGFGGPQLNKGVSYVKAHLSEARDPYTLAVILNLLTRVDRNGETTSQAASDLIKMAKTTNKTAYWQTDTPTFTGANGGGADLETTGLAAFGLVKWGRDSGFTNKALAYLVQSKDSFGTWSSTQGTVWSMKSLLYASQNGVGGGKGTVTVVANGQKAATWAMTPDDSDVMRQVNLGNELKEGSNEITLQYEGEGSPLYQIVGRYYLPWEKVDAVRPAAEPLSLAVAYDKHTLAQDDTAAVTVTIQNTTDKTAEMPLIDVGVPPGFTVVPDKLEDAVQAKTIDKYTVAARQIIIYLQKLNPGQSLTLTYSVKARFPIKARTPLSKAYPYYNPEKVSISAPQDLVVNG